MPVDACIGRVNEVGATAINGQRYAYYACTSQRKLTFGARDSTSQIDVKQTLWIEAERARPRWRRRLAMSGDVVPLVALGLPRLALMDGNSGRLGRTNGGRWGEATRSVNPPFASNLRGHFNKQSTPIICV
jgi:hypothetical protein